MEFLSLWFAAAVAAGRASLFCARCSKCGYAKLVQAEAAAACGSLPLAQSEPPAKAHAGPWARCAVSNASVALRRTSLVLLLALCPRRTCAGQA